MNTKEQLLKQIDALVTERTFSLEAVDAINQMRVMLATVTDERDDLNDKLNRAQQTIIEQEFRTKRDADVLAKWGKREADLMAREQKAAAAIYEAEKHAAVALAYKDAMGIVFRPNVMRETVARNAMDPMPTGGYTVSTNSTTTTTREDA